MRLSTQSVDEDQAVAVIHAALDAGVTLLDTANVYCRDDQGIGDNERLVARALETWRYDRSGVRVATKGGLTRRGRRWIPDGRAKALALACEASRAALGTETIDLYQLHVVDPRTPLETSIRALGRLLERGWIHEIGLCNVTVGQIRVAQQIAFISSVQVELNPYVDTHLRNGVVEYCRDHGIRVLAYRPFGGDRHARVARDPVFNEIADRHGVTPYQVVLAWLGDLPADIIPLPGPSRVTTAADLKAVGQIELSDEDRRRLDARFPAARIVRVPLAKRRPRADAQGDVVLLMGYPGAGKSTVARDYEVWGYRRLNRDEHGGRVADLLPLFERGMEAGQRRWVIDNTSPSRAGRNLFIETAWRFGLPIRCVWLMTSKEDAQINAITRLVQRYRHLPTPEELRVLAKRDPAAFGPAAQHRYERELEAPAVNEGFVRVDEQPFVRDAAALEARALIIEGDGALWDRETVAGDAEPTILSGRSEVLRRYIEGGWAVFVMTWRPGAGAGTAAEVSTLSWLTRIRQLLGVPMEFGYCPHEAGPPVCWCRKPLPGLPIEFAIRHGVDLRQSIVVGTSAADKSLARRLGAAYHEAHAFFKTLDQGTAS